MRSLTLLLIATYRKLISPFFPSSCRFYPSCSEYAKQAIGKYGVLQGGWLALRRISRCHPRNLGGLDLVP